MIDAARRFVYALLELPAHVQYRIAREAGVAHEGEYSDPSMLRLWIERAREGGQLEKFKELVLKELGGQPHV